LEPQPVAAFAGVAQPEGFFKSLEELGYQVVGKRVFADHHPFGASDIEDLRRTYPGVPLVCTEKDAVKMRDIPSNGCFALKVNLKVAPSDAFIVHVVRAIGPSRTSAGTS
jgi:tetraacyldisaccharide 4'-kinase